MKYKKSLIIFLYFGYTLKTKYDNTGDFYYFFCLTSGDWKHPKNTSFSFFYLFLEKFRPPPQKKGCLKTLWKTLNLVSNGWDLRSQAASLTAEMQWKETEKKQEREVTGN